MVGWLASAALANDGPAAPEVRPWVAPWDIQERYDAWRSADGKPPATLACEPLWPDHARLCFRRVEAGRLVRVHVGELEPDALKLGAGRDAAAWVAAELETVPVEGSSSTYRRLRDGEGRAALGVLRPEVIGEQLGVPFMAAFPSSGTLLAWAAGDAQLDQILAVGAREIHDKASDPVSPTVHVWDGTRWYRFAEAVPTP